MKVYSFEVSGVLVGIAVGTGVEVGSGLGVDGTSVAVGVTVGASVTGGSSVADGDSVRIGEEETIGVLVGVSEDALLPQAAKNKAAVMHGMKYLLNFFIACSFRCVPLTTLSQTLH